MKVQNELENIREQSKKYDRVQSLMHNVNKRNLIEKHDKQKKRKATGVDGVTKEMYEENLDVNVDELLGKMRAMRYRPQPSLRVEIPKENGKTRPLGIPCYEDKLVQGVMADVLSAVYDTRFYNCSYGFRPKRNAHQAIAQINHTIMFDKVNYILDCDIKEFFDNVDHKWLTKFLENDIEDPKFIRYMVRFLKAGVLKDMKYYKSKRGTPQGGLVSPILANVYMHYVLDEWFEEGVKKSLKGTANLVRFADDFVIMFQHVDEAKKVYKALIERLAKFNLEINEEKTRIIPFGRFKGTKETFDFLGFTHINGKTREGKYTVHHQTSKKKLQSKKIIAKEWLRERMHKPMWETMESIKKKLQGHYNYYGVNGNYKGLLKFYKYMKYKYYKVVRRRGQKRPIKYKDYNRIWSACKIPKPRLVVNIWF